MYASPYSGAIDCLRKIRQREGLSVLYRSYTTQLTMNIPFHSLHLVTYELLQDYLNYARNYDPLSHVISGAGAGAIASAVTTPLDVCKTLLNTQECCLASSGGPTCAVPKGAPGMSTAVTEEARGLITAVRVIYTQGGVPAFFKGLTPRVLYQMPSTAVAWSCYEFFVSIRRARVRPPAHTRLSFAFRSIRSPANQQCYDLCDLFVSSRSVISSPTDVSPVVCLCDEIKILVHGFALFCLVPAWLASTASAKATSGEICSVFRETNERHRVSLLA